MNSLARRLCASVIALSIGLVLSPLARAALEADPTGDTFNGGAIDITGIGVTPSLPTLTFTLTFASAVAAPSAFAPNSLIGFLDIDADQNAATGGDAPWGGPVTGGNNWINNFIPPNPGTPTIPGPFIALGDEFYINFNSELFHPGLIDLIDTATNLTIGVAPIIFAGTTVQIFLPTALIGNDTQFNFGVIAGNFIAPTDRAPNGATPVASVAPIPEPATLALLGVGLAGIAASRRRKLN